VTLAVLAALAGPATASDLLLTPEAHPRVAPSPLPGVARQQALRLDTGRLATLRRETAPTVAGFPLGGGRTATLTLHRLDPFGRDPKLVLAGPDGETRLPVPDRVWFVGGVAGDASARAVLVAAPDGVHGWVATGGDVVVFGPDAGGRHRAWALSDVDPTVHRPPGDFCLNDVHAAQMNRAAVAQALAPATSATPAPARTTTAREVQLAIDTDRELRLKFGSEAATLEYLGDLVAAANVIYERDVAVHITASYVRVWGATDPWTATDTLGALDEVQAWWLDPTHDMDTVAGTRDAVHFVSGKDVQGGVAYLSAVCEHDWAFGVSQVFGSFDVSTPAEIWDVLVFTHELGHTLGSPHTHCYEPPIDKCYSGESGCYAGAVVPTSNGTIMSYCHLNDGGLANVHLVFGDRVSAQIEATVAAASCLADVEVTCGNGTVDPGEDCDDGNTSSGDGCSATCHWETTCGDGVQEGNEQCDDGNVAAGDGCSPSCRFEICGNAVVDPGEDCDDGNASAGDGCSPTCTREPRCGDGILDAGEDCDDGNGVSGDGCSAACVEEPCAIVVPHQAQWAPARLSWTKGKAADRLKLKARFAVPAGSTPDVIAGGLQLVLEGATGPAAATLALPAGAAWKTDDGVTRWWDERDGAGSMRLRNLDGMVKTVDVRLVARGDLPVGGLGLPLTATLLLGDDAAARAGACGRWAWPVVKCSGGARRVQCR
jgi:cysteine-rich repeat protein